VIDAPTATSVGVLVPFTELIPNCPKWFLPHDKSLPFDVFTYAAFIPNFTDTAFSPVAKTPVIFGVKLVRVVR
jgi:hypothetical protein